MTIELDKDGLIRIMDILLLDTSTAKDEIKKLQKSLKAGTIQDILADKYISKCQEIVKKNTHIFNNILKPQLDKYYELSNH